MLLCFVTHRVPNFDAALNCNLDHIATFLFACNDLIGWSHKLLIELKRRMHKWNFILGFSFLKPIFLPETACLSLSGYARKRIDIGIWCFYLSNNNFDLARSIQTRPGILFNSIFKYILYKPNLLYYYTMFEIRWKEQKFKILLFAFTSRTKLTMVTTSQLYP